MIRIYQDLPLLVGETVDLDEKASHHLLRVLRVQPGDQVVLFNGQGGQYLTEITALSKRNVTVLIKSHALQDNESSLPLILAQGIAKGEKMDFILQKSVELGVKEIYPLITERCNVHLDAERQAKRLERWQAVIISACEQCGRNRLPIIHAPLSISDWLAQHKGAQGILLSPRAPHGLSTLKLLRQKPLSLLIGPEGGLSDQEEAKALRQGFVAAKMGPRVLRTETATVSALSILQYSQGDLG